MSRTVTENVLWILFATGLVVLNGFFVAAEFALVKVRPTRLAHLVRQKRPFAATAQWLAKRLDRSLSACQLGITVASLGLGWVGEPAIARLMEPLFGYFGITRPAAVHAISFAVAFTVITAAHLVLGEQAPKIFAIRRAEQLVVWCAAPMKFFYVISYPLLRALDTATSAVLRMVGMRKGSEHEAPHSQEELMDLVGLSRAHGELSGWEHRLVEAAFDFDDMVCRQIMVPRNDVVVMDVGMTAEEVLEAARQTRHTRYPVCEGSLDEVVGILHMKDVVGLEVAGDFDLRSFVRPPRYVPETIRISRLLGHFRVTRQHMALVVDEHGIVVGIVTLENVLEQIVGPVRDEFDVEDPQIIPEGEGSFLVQGATPVERIEELLDVRFGVQGVDTAAGLIAVELGRVPEQGDHLVIDDISLEVRDVRRNHASLVRVSRGKGETGSGG